MVHNRGHAESRAEHVARGGVGARHATFARHPARRLPGGHVRLITGVLLAIARDRRDRAADLHRAGNSLFTADPRGPMSALPLIIYEFARSPYAEQQKLAWTGALILTFAVLALSILARVASASVKQK